MQDLRSRLLEHALPLVPFTGWTDHTLRDAAERAGLDDFSVKRAFPGGAAAMLDYFFTQADETLARSLPEAELAAKRMPERIEALILARLAYWLPHREAVRRAVAMRTLPWKLAHASTSLYKSVDLMWRIAGDKSTDFSFYTKRMTLAALYSSTLLFWLNDESEAQADTHAFLLNRLQNIADFGKWKKKWKSG